MSDNTENKVLKEIAKAKIKEYKEILHPHLNIDFAVEVAEEYAKEEVKKACKDQTIKVGKFTIAPSLDEKLPNSIWVTTDEGEGTTIDMDELWKHFF